MAECEKKKQQRDCAQTSYWIWEEKRKKNEIAEYEKKKQQRDWAQVSY